MRNGGWDVRWGEPPFLINPPPPPGPTMAHRCPSCTSPATRIAAGLWTCRRHGPLPAAKSGPQSDEMAEALKRHAPALGINTQ